MERAVFGPERDQRSERLLEVLRELMAQTHPERAPRQVIGLDALLDRDLGIDSLARVELALRIERAFGVRLDERTLADAETPRDLLDALAGARAVAAAPAGVETFAVEAEGIAAPVGEPDSAITLGDVLDWHVARHPDRVHLHFLASDERVETMRYRDLDARARRVAAGLAACGVTPRQTVALMLPSGTDFFAAFYGALRIGAIPVPLYPPARLGQIEDHLRRQVGILANCEATHFITVPEAKFLARLVRGEVASLRQVSTVAELEALDGALPGWRAAPDDIAFLQYTSGSTGQPKGVILTHAQVLANIRAMGRAAGVDPRDVFVSWLPLYHDMGLIGAWMTSLYFSLHVVLMSPLAFLASPVRWLRTIQAWRATISAAPNFAYELCATRLDERDLEGLDLSTWRWAFNGAETVNADTLERFAARFARYGLDPKAIAPVYGLAECALDLAFPPSRRGMLVDTIDREALATANHAEPVPAAHPRATKIVACGRVLPGYSIRIVDERGRELPERAEGRVEFKGPSATSGYYRNPEATAALRDGEWFDTGDLGYLADGDLYPTGRAKDLIIRAGHNIYPNELEAAIGDLVGIRKGCVAVFAARDRAGGTERVVVLAETRETDPARRDGLRAAIDNLAVDLLGAPADEVVLAPPHSVLKTSSGKLRRAATRERYEHGLIGVSGHAVWIQFVRLGARSIVARMRRWLEQAGAWGYGVYVGVVVAIAALSAVAMTLVPGLARRRRIAQFIARTGLNVLAVPLRIEGLEHLPRDRAFVLVANHASYLDAVLLIAAIPRDLAFIAKAEFRRHRLARWLFESVGTRFVERFDTQQSMSDARALAALSAQGESIAIFPEGTFRPRAGLLPFRMGAFITAAQAAAPVVPVALTGTRNALPWPSWRLRHVAIRLSVGEPVFPSGTDWTAAVAMRDAVRNWILGRCGDPDAGGEG